MKNDDFCDGCGMLCYDKPVNRYDCHRAMCCDPDKPMMGARRVLTTAVSAKPRFIHSPAWCRGKEAR